MKPGDIERTSFAIIDSEVPEPRPFEGHEWSIVRRMIHTTADFELLSLVKFHPDAVSAGVGRLKMGCTVVTDTEMARSGITAPRMDTLGCKVQCFLNDLAVLERAGREEITRSAAAVDLAVSQVHRGIFVVGNAPTALLRLLKRVEEDPDVRPALIIGMPVGFVNAAESKEQLMEQEAVPYVTIMGRKGGSAVAASVVNALAELALAKE
ncbi:MAG: precorrin-8X methylmutase [Deltaproteobacteria bacterium]|nr:MAG: precorrin-8X methylmutase [Deltaproteobacteria bacterium]